MVTLVVSGVRSVNCNYALSEVVKVETWVKAVITAIVGAVAAG